VKFQWDQRNAHKRPVLRSGLLVACILLPSALWGQLAIRSVDALQSFFPGESMVRVFVSNRSGSPISKMSRVRVYQEASATAALFSEMNWKKLDVLPGQTVLETAIVPLPAVTWETRFLLQWLDDSGSVLGSSVAIVYPTNLLKELAILAGHQALGVYDPADELKSLLTNQGVEVADLQSCGIAQFTGRLAVIGPFLSKEEIYPGLKRQIKRLAERGVAVLWIEPPPGPADELQPSFSIQLTGKGCLVIIQAELVTHLAASPEAQSHLVRLARLTAVACPKTLVKSD
jgi:hypothetical protein